MPNGIKIDVASGRIHGSYDHIRLSRSSSLPTTMTIWISTWWIVKNKWNKWRHLSPNSEAEAALPFGPIEGNNWFSQISSQWEFQKNQSAFISFGKIQRRYDMNGRSHMQGGKNLILPKEINANRFFWDSHWLEIWKYMYFPLWSRRDGEWLWTQFRPPSIWDHLFMPYCLWEGLHYATLLQGLLKMKLSSGKLQF